MLTFRHFFPSLGVATRCFFNAAPIRHVLVGMIFALAWSVAAEHAIGQADSDFQVWNENTVTIPLLKTAKGKDRLALLLLQTNRLRNAGFRPDDLRAGFGFDVLVNKHLSISPSYQYRAANPLPRIWEYEHRLRFDATLSFGWKNFGMKNRNRVERRIRNGATDTTRYRNRTTLRVPVLRKNDRPLDAFASIEPYYETGINRWTYYEVMAGVTTDLSRSISADIFYLRRSPMSVPIQTINGIGFNLKFRID